LFIRRQATHVVAHAAAPFSPVCRDSSAPLCVLHESLFEVGHSITLSTPTQSGRRPGAQRGGAVRWGWFTDTARVRLSMMLWARALSFHPGGNDVPESLPLILTALVILMSLGAISGVVVVAGLALFDELSAGERQPR
jgi:hypothetical protein